MNRESLLLNIIDRESVAARRRRRAAARGFVPSLVAAAMSALWLLVLLAALLGLAGCSCTFAPVAYQRQEQHTCPERAAERAP